MLSVLLPAHNEERYLNRTIDNIFSTKQGEVEVIVVDQGGNGPIDPRAVVISTGSNVGERRAMNHAADTAKGSWLFRIDAHCDFSPVGWDIMLTDVTGPTDLTMAVLTAIRKPKAYCDEDEQAKWKDEWTDWERLPGHWYGFTHFVASESGYGTGLEAKWQKANTKPDKLTGVWPTMAATGCAMCISRSFYDKIGGADETLPPMGAIGEEFAIKAWAFPGGKCQVLTDVMVGHVFGTGGYDTSGVDKARHMLYEKYEDIYKEVIARPEFASFANVRVVKATQPGKPIREVTILRKDVTDSHGPGGVLTRRKTETFRYVWRSDEHPDEIGFTDAELEEKYAPQGIKVKKEVVYFDDNGNEVVSYENH